MNEDFNKIKYYDFEDRLNWDKFRNEGIAELERWYKISGRFLPPTLVAKGIMAFLSFDNGPDDYFGYSLKHGKQLNFDNIFQLYFDQCFKFLIAKEQEISSKSERKTRTELIRLHLKNEERLIIESHQLDCGLLNDNRQVFERIKKAAKDYRDWFNETNTEAGILVPKINEDNIEPLFAILGNYFEPKEQFMNFLTGNQIEGKINFTGNQNQLAGIFIYLRLNREIILGTHQQTFDFIKQIFLMKGKPICTGQILTYLKDISKANEKKFIDISL